jgi:hypothetical protein
MSKPSNEKTLACVTADADSQKIKSRFCTEGLPKV